MKLQVRILATVLLSALPTASLSTFAAHVPQILDEQLHSLEPKYLESVETIFLASQRSSLRSGVQRTAANKLQADDGNATIQLSFGNGQNPGRSGDTHTVEGICFILLMCLCLSCCCLSGAAGPCGFVCGAILPVIIITWMLFFTTTLQRMLNGQPVGFWCSILGIWVIMNLLLAICVLIMWCCGWCGPIMLAGGVIVWLVAIFSQKDGKEESPTDVYTIPGVAASIIPGVAASTQPKNKFQR